MDFVDNIWFSYNMCRVFGAVYSPLYPRNKTLYRIIDLLCPFPLIAFYAVSIRCGISAIQQSSYIDNGPPVVIDLLVIGMGFVTMLIRILCYFQNKTVIKRLMFEIAKMGKQQGIEWKRESKPGLLLVLAEVSIFFTCDFLATIFSVIPNGYWFFTYATLFIVGFIENYFIYEVQSGIRRIFASINSKIQIGEKEEKDKRIDKIIVCAREHFDLVLVANEVSEVFGLVMASWLALNFFQLTGEVNYCWLCWKRMFTSGKFVPKAFTSTFWIILLLANLVFLIGSWQCTADENPKIFVLAISRSFLALLSKPIRLIEKRRGEDKRFKTD